jgi:hypothetical protein
MGSIPAARCASLHFAGAEVVQVDVATARRRKEERALRCRQPVERFEGDRLERHGADAPPRLRRLNLPAQELAADVHDAGHVVQVLVYQLGELHCRSGTKAVERALQRPLRLGARREATHLRAFRAAAVDAVAIRPHRLPFSASPARLQLQNLTPLCHRGTPLESTTNRGIETSREGDDPFSTEGTFESASWSSRERLVT